MSKSRSLFATVLLATMVVCQAAIAQSWVGKWRILSVAGVERIDSRKASLELRSDGRVGATIGCNRLVTRATISDASIGFGATAATRMACPPPLDKQERALIRALSQVRSLKLDGPRLSLRSGSGRVLILLGR